MNVFTAENAYHSPMRGWIRSKAQTERLNVFEAGNEGPRQRYVCFKYTLTALCNEYVGS